MNPQTPPSIGNENQQDISTSIANQPTTDLGSNNKNLSQGSNKSTLPNSVVAGNFASEEITNNKKKRRLHKKTELIIEIILVMVLLATVYVKFFAPKSNSSIAASQINVQSSLLSTNGWETFNDGDNSVSFKYPDVNDPGHLTGAADQSGGGGLSDAPTTDVSPDAQSINITFPDDTKSDLHDWATQNNQPYGGTLTGPTENMTLNIALSTSPSSLSSSINNSSPSSVVLASKQPVTGYTYKLISGSNGDEELEQCQSSGSCTTNIKRSNTAYPYASASISPEAGTIDFHSHNFAVMKTVLSMLDLFANQTNPNYSVASNLTPCNIVKGMTQYQGIGGGQTAIVVSKDETNKTLALSYDPYSATPSKPQTVIIPRSAPIIGIKNTCHTITFDSIQVYDGVNLYSASSHPNEVGIVGDTDK